MPRALRTRLGLAGCALALTGPMSACGHQTVVGPLRTVRIELSEYRLAPDSVRARAGELSIVVHNHGRVKHDLALSLNGRLTAGTQPIWPGQSTRLTVELGPGQYMMASTVLSDQALGEYGTLVVNR